MLELAFLFFFPTFSYICEINWHISLSPDCLRWSWWHSSITAWTVCQGRG